MDLSIFFRLKETRLFTKRLFFLNLFLALIRTRVFKNHTLTFFVAVAETEASAAAAIILTKAGDNLVEKNCCCANSSFLSFFHF